MRVPYCDRRTQIKNRKNLKILCVAFTKIMNAKHADMCNYPSIPLYYRLHATWHYVGPVIKSMIYRTQIIGLAMVSHGQGQFKAIAINLTARGLEKAGCISDFASNIFCYVNSHIVNIT
jgi:hypothetical protein